MKNKPDGERLKELNLLSLATKETFKDLVFIISACLIGLLWFGFVLTADSSNYNLKHANYQLKIRYARTNVLNFPFC